MYLMILFCADLLTNSLNLKNLVILFGPFFVIFWMDEQKSFSFFLLIFHVFLNLRSIIWLVLLMITRFYWFSDDVEKMKNVRFFWIITANDVSGMRNRQHGKKMLQANLPCFIIDSQRFFIRSISMDTVVKKLQGRFYHHSPITTA